MWNLIKIFQMAGPGDWRFYSRPMSDLKMRRRDSAGEWEYREPTPAEIEEFEELDAW
jgi:hypothetical protein